MHRRRGPVHPTGRGFGLDPSGESAPELADRRQGRLDVRAVAQGRPCAGISAVVHRPDGQPYASTPVWIWEAVVADAASTPRSCAIPCGTRRPRGCGSPGSTCRRRLTCSALSVQTAVKIYGQWTLEGQEAAADALASGIGVKAAVSFAIKSPPRSRSLSRGA